MTTRNRQTIGRHAHGSLRLPVSEAILSPYWHTSYMSQTETGRDISISLNMIKAFYLGYVSAGATASVSVLLKDSVGSNNGCITVPLTITTSDTDTTVLASIPAAVAAYCTDSLGITLDSSEWLLQPDTTVLPGYVSGVAKTGYYPVVGSPSVAGGSGVVRFYIDTNGDGTGTAPSEVFAPSLQAVVVNGTNTYVPSAVTVDTNKKYIDITMKALTFSTGVAALVNVLTGASLTNAANGTVVNCLVLVKK